MRSGSYNTQIYAQQEARDIKEVVAEACPEPNPRIVQRLRDAWKTNDFSIRLPWQSAPAPASYNEEDIQFARILTMLAKLDIYPPAVLQAAKGPSLPNFDGPLTFVPEGQTSGRTFNVEMTELEAKENALANNRRGSLADAAEGQMTVLLTRQARNQQMALIAEYRRQLAAEEAKIDAKLNDDEKTNRRKQAIFGRKRIRDIGKHGIPVWFSRCVLRRQ